MKSIVEVDDQRLLNKLGRHVIRPVKSFFMALALMRGCFYIAKYRLLTRGRVKIDFPFFCYTRGVRISGRGRVLIGAGCSVFVNNFDRLSIVTLTENAVVVLGKKCSLGGVNIRCAGRVSLGDHVMVAASLIQDVPFICPYLEGDNGACNLEATITIGDHVWLSARSIVLNSSSIGNGSILSVGAVLFREAVGDFFLVLGNLARRPLPIANLLKLKIIK